MPRDEHAAAFRRRVHDWAARLDVRVGRLSIRPMRHKWASCSTRGTVSFSVDVLGLDAELQDYVVVHELLHLAVPNHGRLWKSLMQLHLNGYERLDARLHATGRTGRR